MVCIPGASHRIASCQVEADSVTTCRRSSRSYQALCRTPWWPGWQPVSKLVWLGNVTVGREANGSVAESRPVLDQPAIVGASPLEAMS